MIVTPKQSFFVLTWKVSLCRVRALRILSLRACDWRVGGVAEQAQAARTSEELIAKTKATREKRMYGVMTEQLSGR